MTKTLDIDTPDGAREYIAISRKGLLPPTTDRVTMGSGEVILLDSMTDEQAMRVAKSVYFYIELPFARGANKQ